MPNALLVDTNMVPLGTSGNPLYVNDGGGSLGTVAIDQTTLGSTNGVTIAKGATAQVGIAAVVSAVAESSHVLKGTPGNLYSVSGYIGAPGWIMLFNATSAPADGAVTPVYWLYSSAAGSWSIDFADVPMYFSTGITVVTSSTGPLTKTAYSTNTVFSGRIV